MPVESKNKMPMVPREQRMAPILHGSASIAPALKAL
jgi:hypothetical protein